MDESNRFAAPWGLALKIITGACVGLLFAVMVTGFAVPKPGEFFWLPLMVGLPAVILLASAFFVIRGYELVGTTLIVQRLGWQSTLELRELAAAWHDPAATRGSLKLWGNGGFFCFAGWFWNRKLGRYRAYANDLKRLVVLSWPGRTAVVSPDDPAAFIRAVRAATGAAGAPAGEGAA